MFQENFNRNVTNHLSYSKSIPCDYVNLSGNSQRAFCLSKRLLRRQKADTRHIRRRPLRYWWLTRDNDHDFFSFIELWKMRVRCKKKWILQFSRCHRSHAHAHSIYWYRRICVFSVGQEQIYTAIKVFIASNLWSCIKLGLDFHISIWGGKFWRTHAITGKARSIQQLNMGNFFLLCLFARSVTEHSSNM